MLESGMSHPTAKGLEHPTYRADIDGLRAVAVLAVVCFHAFPNFLHGGFIGVDIFFVISGFLISSIIFSNLEHNRFSLIEFYSRRIRRIFPALLLVMAAAAVYGWFTLYADEFRLFGKHVKNAALFALNFTLWRESGYFDNASEAKPLLHLWSLAVEEQFYIIWPLLLIVVWKWKKKWNFFAFTALVAAVSFLLNLYAAKTNTVADFYAPYTRFWELMAGSLLAYAEAHKMRLPKKYASLQSVCGIILLALGFVCIDETLAFPGWWALLPVTGALLVISAKQEAWINKNILSGRLLVGIGLISYPLYLWHWPLLSFSRIVSGHTLAWECRSLLVLAAIILSWLTYMFVEKPVRYGGSGGRKTILMLILMLIVGSFGYAVRMEDGFTFRAAAQDGLLFDARTDNFGYAKCTDKELTKGMKLDFCERLAAPEKIDAAIIGDSHAEDKFNGIVKTDKNRSWMLIAESSCPPVYDISVVGYQKDCETKSERIIDWVMQNKQIKTVALSFLGSYFLTTPYAADHLRMHTGGPQNTKITSRSVALKSREEIFFYGLDQAVSRLLAAHKKVIIFLDVPELPFSPRDCIRQKMACKVPVAEVMQRQSALRSELEKLRQRYPDLLIYDPTPMFCNETSCVFRDLKTVFYRDSHHISHAGSDIYAARFISWLNSQ